jgi:putative endopeptidase
MRDLPAKEEIRTKYVKHVESIFVLAGMSQADAEKASKEVMTLETKIAAASLKMVERRDPVKTYNKVYFTQCSAP